MRLLTVRHVTTYRYSEPVRFGEHRMMFRPRESHDLSSLRCLVSGSAPLLPHHYRFALEQVKADLHVTSPAWGTDIMGSLATLSRSYPNRNFMGGRNGESKDEKVPGDPRLHG